MYVLHLASFYEEGMSNLNKTLQNKDGTNTKVYYDLQN